MKQIIKDCGIMALFITVLAACNKEVEVQKALSVEIMGYNVGSAQLEVTIDTVTFRKYKIEPNLPIAFSKIYPYPSDKSQAVLSVKDVQSGKEVLNHTLALSSGGLELFIPFVWLNGSSLPLTSPAADPASNKLGFYVYYPLSNDAVDIFWKNPEGEIAYLAKNINPGTWVFTDYLPQPGFTDINKTYYVFVTKAGTTTTWAFDDEEWKSKIYYGGLFFPMSSNDKGLVRSYFITPGTDDLKMIRLFKTPQ